MCHDFVDVWFKFVRDFIVHHMCNIKYQTLNINQSDDVSAGRRCMYNVYGGIK